MQSIDLGPLMETLDPPMAIVTAAADGEWAGCLVGFHSQSSIEPPRHAVWLSRVNRTYRMALRAPVLGVHFLDRDDRILAEHFGGETGDSVDKFEGREVEIGPTGVPLLVGCPARLVLRRTAVLASDGDHVCFEGEPESIEWTGRFEPMRLSDVLTIEAGHERD